MNLFFVVYKLFMHACFVRKTYTTFIFKELRCHRVQKTFNQKEDKFSFNYQNVRSLTFTIIERIERYIE